MKSKYWSCSKFADFVRGTPKPKSATLEEWGKWKKDAKLQAFRYWLAEEGLDRFQDVVYFPKTVWDTIGRWYDNRFVTKTHVLSTGLKKGKWHEFDQRLLHGMFNSLVDFVECEGAWMNVVFDKNYKRPWFRRFRQFREPEHGIAWLKWQMTLTNEYGDNPNDPSPQAINAKELYELYIWWKELRPARLDPYEVSGWSAYCAQTRKPGKDPLFFLERDRNKDDEEKVTKMLKEMEEIENQYEKVDEEMMIRLIKLRNFMWT